MARFMLPKRTYPANATPEKTEEIDRYNERIRKEGLENARRYWKSRRQEERGRGFLFFLMVFLIALARLLAGIQ